MANGSFFWNQMVRSHSLFQWCIQWEIGDGRSVSYWYDSWGGPAIRPIKMAGPRPRLQIISLRDMITRWPCVCPMASEMIPDFSEQHDVLVWRWSSNGIYSSASIYKLMSAGGRIRWGYSDLWRCYAPLKVKFFTYLWLHNKILTHESMLRRGLHCVPDCALCTNCPMESTFHLFFQCQYALQVWNYFGDLVTISNSVESTWERSWHRYRVINHENKRTWATRFVGVLWGIWRQRNEMIFRGKRMPPFILAERIRGEIQLWLHYGGGSQHKNVAVERADFTFQIH
jgi:hypothetical protein